MQLLHGNAPSPVIPCIKKRFPNSSNNAGAYIQGGAIRAMARSETSGLMNIFWTKYLFLHNDFGLNNVKIQKGPIESPQKPPDFLIFRQSANGQDRCENCSYICIYACTGRPPQNLMHNAQKILTYNKVLKFRRKIINRLRVDSLCDVCLHNSQPTRLFRSFESWSTTDLMLHVHPASNGFFFFIIIINSIEIQHVRTAYRYLHLTRAALHNGVQKLQVITVQISSCHNATALLNTYRRSSDSVGAAVVVGMPALNFVLKIYKKKIMTENTSTVHTNICL